MKRKQMILCFYKKLIFDLYGVKLWKVFWPMWGVIFELRGSNLVNMLITYHCFTTYVLSVKFQHLPIPLNNTPTYPTVYTAYMSWVQKLKVLTEVIPIQMRCVWAHQPMLSNGLIWTWARKGLDVVCAGPIPRE